MANVLSKDKQVLVLRLLCEGGSIRSASRITGVDKGTVTKLLTRFGIAAKSFLDSRLRNLQFYHVEVDELWTYVACKQRNIQPHHPAEAGDAYVYYAIDRESKLIPCFKVGKRDYDTTYGFVTDLAERIDGRVEISTDGWADYPLAIDWAFKNRASHGVIDKSVIADEVHQKKRCVLGSMERRCIGASGIERANCTLRNFVRRCNRRTICFSKKKENLESSLYLYALAQDFRTVAGAGIMVPKGGPTDGRTIEAEAAVL